MASREYERIHALSLDLRANIKLREGYYESAITFAQDALRSRKARGTLAHGATRRDKPARGRGSRQPQQYSVDRRALAQLGALASIDPVQRQPPTFWDLCHERFQDATTHLTTIDVRDVPPEIQRELAGYRALAASTSRPGEREASRAKKHLGHAAGGEPLQTGVRYVVRGSSPDSSSIASQPREGRTPSSGHRSDGVPDAIVRSRR